MPDLDGYRTGVTDIIFGFMMRGHFVTPERVVMEVLNQAFDLALDAQNTRTPGLRVVLFCRHFSLNLVSENTVDEVMDHLVATSRKDSRSRERT